MSGTYSYTLTNGLGSSLTGTASGMAFSQSLPASGSGSQSFTLTLASAGGTVSASTDVTVNAATFTVSNPAICPGQRVNLDNFIGNKSPITGDVTYFTTLADAQAGTNALSSALVGPVNNPITYYARYDAAGCFSIQPIMVTLKPASPAPPALTQTGHAYTGGVASVSVAQNSESVILAVPGCDGTVLWSGPNNFVSFNSTISVPTSTTGSFTYSASCTSQTACYSGSSQATVTVNTLVCGAGLSGPIWTGCVSTDWNTAGNWASGAIPTATDDVVIPSAPANQPVLSTTATAQSVEVQTGASLSISSAGRLTINGSKNIDGFTTAFSNRGMVQNAGLLILGNTADVGAFAIWNRSSFTNNGGEIRIDRTTNQGINNNVGLFTNTGTITIGALASVGQQGILNQAAFANTGGTITIDRTTSDGLLNSGNFVNSATITIGASAPVTGNGIANAGTFSNSACARLTVVAPINNTNTFTNAGLFTISTTRLHSNTGTLTNNGLISYPQGNPILTWLTMM